MVNINIPLPVSCASCPLSVRHFGKLYCPPLDGRVGNEGKDERCPLMDAEDRGDLISRQEVLNVLEKLQCKTCGTMANYAVLDAICDVANLPSAQPIRCKDCRWRDDYGHWLGCPVLNTDDDNFCSMAERRTDDR